MDLKPISFIDGIVFYIYKVREPAKITHDTSFSFSFSCWIPLLLLNKRPFWGSAVCRPTGFASSKSGHAS